MYNFSEKLRIEYPDIYQLVLERNSGLTPEDICQALYIAARKDTKDAPLTKMPKMPKPLSDGIISANTVSIAKMLEEGYNKFLNSIQTPTPKFRLFELADENEPVVTAECEREVMAAMKALIVILAGTNQEFVDAGRNVVEKGFAIPMLRNNGVFTKTALIGSLSLLEEKDYYTKTIINTIINLLPKD